MGPKAPPSLCAKMVLCYWLDLRTQRYLGSGRSGDAPNNFRSRVQTVQTSSELSDELEAAHCRYTGRECLLCSRCPGFHFVCMPENLTGSRSFTPLFRFCRTIPNKPLLYVNPKRMKNIVAVFVAAVLLLPFAAALPMPMPMPAPADVCHCPPASRIPWSCLLSWTIGTD